MKNENLSEFYNSVYKKGEESHYSRYRIGASSEFDEIIGAVDWKNKKVLDVGCGTGLFDHLIAERGAEVLAIDYSENAIEVAKKNYQLPNLNFSVGEASTVEGMYDVIVSLGTLEHMDNPLEILKIFKKHLKPNGTILITCPNWLNPRGYMLMFLKFIFDAPITLADLHYLTVADFETWSKELGMKLTWKTFDHSWAHGEILISDLKRRLPNVFRDARMDIKEENINSLLGWLKDKALVVDQTAHYSGAMALYILK